MCFNRLKERISLQKIKKLNDQIAKKYYAFFQRRVTLKSFGFEDVGGGKENIPPPPKHKSQKFNYSVLATRKPL
jgi:hypothetical protein